MHETAKTSPPATMTAHTAPSSVNTSPGMTAATLHTPNISTPTPSRPSACIGGAYVARWAWRRLARPEERHGSFEDEVKLLLRKRWAASQAPAVIGLGVESIVAPPRLSRSASAGFMRAASGLAATMFNEEDEYAEENADLSMDDASAYGNGRMRTMTATTSSSSFGMGGTMTGTPSTVQTSPGIGTLATATLGGHLSSPSGILPLSPITGGGATSVAATVSLPALPTDDKDVQINLVKVADSDHDAFLSYAAIVPEYCRLEGMLVKALV